MSKRVAIIGFGHVGAAYYKMFPDAVIYDPYKSVNNDPYSRFDDKRSVNHCDLAIICVPTPMSEDGSCDISEVENTLKWIKTPLILMKSTVPPGTTDYLKKKYKKRVVFSPEYVGESSYWSPYNWSAVEEPFVICGGDKKDTSEILDFFIAKGGPTKRYIQSDALTAELCKYMENVFYATKVTFCNEFFEIAKHIGVDYNELRELWLADPRIHKMHTVVFKDKRGFDGKCLPKDTNALIKASEKAGYVPKLIKQVIDSNNDFLAMNNKEVPKKPISKTKKSK